tara:strand:- start:1343 stop:1468 length:126 start_codon:yes stop_codon:yes gene_type:complete
MAKAKKTTSKRGRKKKALTFWDRVARGIERLFSSALPKRGK